MTMESTTNAYGSKNVILQFPDDYVCRPQFFDEQSTLAVKENGRFIIKAGTPFPTNDAHATGIVFNDLDVTNGDANGAVMVRGHLNLDKVEENTGIKISEACKTALKGIYFYPLGGTIADTTTLIDGGSGVKAKDVDPEILVKVEGTDFAPKKASQNISNYTINPGSTGLTVKSINRLDDKTIELVTTGTAVAGPFTIQAKAPAVVNGVQSNVATVTILA